MPPVIDAQDRLFATLAATRDHTADALAVRDISAMLQGATLTDERTARAYNWLADVLDSQ
jgi:hypothetical protein